MIIKIFIVDENIFINDQTFESIQINMHKDHKSAINFTGAIGLIWIPDKKLFI